MPRNSILKLVSENYLAQESFFPPCLLWFEASSGGAGIFAMTEFYHNFFLFSSWISIYSSRNKYICIYRHILGGGENNDGGMREGEEKRIRRKIYESES